MYSLRSIFQQKAFYFISFLVALVFALLLISITGKINCFMMLNSMHSVWLDAIFTGFAFLGYGNFSIIIAAVLLSVLKYRPLSLHIIITYLASGVTAQFLQKIYMSPRPDEIIKLHLYSSFTEGNSASGWGSFPSDHTTAVFALATILALYSNKKRWALVFLATAITVGYSSIYLGQHFLQDVLAGAVLGTGMGILIYAIVRFNGEFFQTKPPVTNLADNSSSSGLAGK